MYKCNNCNHEFDNPTPKETTYEMYYGVSSEIASRTPITLYLCPWCENDDIEFNDEEGEEEYE